MREATPEEVFARGLVRIVTEAQGVASDRCYAACVAILAALDPASEAADGARMCVEAVRSLRGAVAESGRPGCGPVAPAAPCDPGEGSTAPSGPRAEPLAAPRKETDGYPPAGPRSLP